MPIFRLSVYEARIGRRRRRSEEICQEMILLLCCWMAGLLCPGNPRSMIDLLFSPFFSEVIAINMNRARYAWFRGLTSSTSHIPTTSTQLHFMMMMMMMMAKFSTIAQKLEVLLLPPQFTEFLLLLFPPHIRFGSAMRVSPLCWAHFWASSP